MSDESTTAILPAFLAGALVNGDESGLERPEDFDLLRRVREYLEGFDVVDCGEPYFSHHGSEVGPFVGDVCDYTLMPL